MIKRVLLWIMWTFIKGFEIIGISTIVLGFMAGLTGVTGVLIWWGWKNGEYLILVSIITGCIFICGLIFRVVWELKLPTQLRKL